MKTLFAATIRGILENPAITEINIRSGPGTSFSLVSKAPVGVSGLPVLAVRADNDGRHFQNKLYQWLQLQFPDGQSGWARDDLIEVQGDGTAFGYGLVHVRTFAFLLKRVESVAVPVPAPPVPVVAAPLPTPAAAPIRAPAAVSATCTAYINMRDGLNARSGPGITFAQVMRAARGMSFTVQEARLEAGGTFKWVRGSISGQSIWIREDLLCFEGDVEAFGLGKNDTYPAPMQQRWWVRGFTGLDGHWGWDFGAATGEPIYAGPQGGLVIASVECSKCTGGRSFKHYGLQLSDPSALNDPAWNFGYGHYVIVRYLNDQLPVSTRSWLSQNGLGGVHLFAMYAHLNSRVVSAGQTLSSRAIIGTCGDTGNSEATHLHLELRASLNPNDTNWATMKRHLLDPVILFGH